MVDLTTFGVRNFTGDLSQPRCWRMLALLGAATIVGVSLATTLDGATGVMLAGTTLTISLFGGVVVLLGRRETIDQQAYEAQRASLENLFPADPFRDLPEEALTEGFVESLLRVQMYGGKGQFGAMEKFKRYQEECRRRDVEVAPLVARARDRLGDNWTQYEWLPPTTDTPAEGSQRTQTG